MMYNIILEAEAKYNSLSENQQKEMMKDPYLLILLRNLEDYGLDLILKGVPTKNFQTDFMNAHLNITSGLGNHISFIPKYDSQTETMTFVFKRKFDF